MAQFQLSKEAKNDLRTIALFTENRWGKTQRNLYIQQLDQAFFLLAKNPNLGVSCDFIREGYRKFPQGSQLIFYKQNADATILVVRILHKSMDYEARL